GEYANHVGFVVDVDRLRNLTRFDLRPLDVPALLVHERLAGVTDELAIRTQQLNTRVGEEAGVVLVKLAGRPAAEVALDEFSNFSFFGWRGWRLWFGSGY